jgi:hypothetical protein
MTQSCSNQRDNNSPGKIVRVLAGAKPVRLAIVLTLDQEKELILKIPVDILEATDIIYARKTIHP